MKFRILDNPKRIRTGPFGPPLTYKSEFPEVFDWGLLDLIKLFDATTNITDRIKFDLKKDNRLLIPGLREALKIIAELADL